MRNAIRLALSAAALAVPVMASAQTGIGAIVATEPCDAIVDPTAAGFDGELYGMKVTTSTMAPRTDILYDAREKGEGRSDGGTLIDATGWAIGPNWTVGQDPSHVHFVVITFDNGRLVLDSGDISTAGAFDPQVLQTFGNTRGGFTLPGTRSTYTVDLGANNAQFPRGTTSNGINIAFPLLIERQAEVVPGCYVGGALPDPTDTTNATPTRGMIIGYNVYRIPDTGGAIPGPTEVMAAINDGNPATGWQYFMDLRTLRLSTADMTGGTMPGTTSPIETTAGTDLAGIQNPDAMAYSGDEFMIFQDAAANGATPRCTGCGTAPSTSQAYWYFAQPVLTGNVADFSNVGWTPNNFQAGDHRIDLDGNGTADAISLDTTVASGHNTPEFISPQANIGLPGLGLTHGGLPFLSAPMHFDPAQALPATGQVRLTGTVSGSNVNLQFTTGLEAGQVIGYNVYRMSGGEPVRVNDQPILAQGNESNAYTLVDQVSEVRRLSRGGDAQYSVEIVYVDGSTRMVGPFDVTLGPETPSRRRR